MQTPAAIKERILKNFMLTFSFFYEFEVIIIEFITKHNEFLRKIIKSSKSLVEFLLNFCYFIPIFRMLL